MDVRTLLRPVAALGLLGSLGFAAAGQAGTAGAAAGAGRPQSCSGTYAVPGVLAGTYANGVVVSGFCDVNGGAAVVTGNLTIAAGATLEATFVNNDQAGSGSSSLTVSGNVKVQSGASLIMGCEPTAFVQCFDDSSRSADIHIGGNLVSRGALGVVVHASTITGNVSQSTGGGGVNCSAPSNPFFASFGEKVAFSDYEDNAIGGNLHITGLQTCWIGIIRNTVQGSAAVRSNTFADPDANETIQNTVHTNMTCSANSPAVHFGDSGGLPNQVHGKATGECAFTALSGGSPISVKA